MDDILRLLATLALYAVIFVAVGIVFYEIDKRFKRWVNRPRCAVCNTRLEDQAIAGGPALCAACSSRNRVRRRR